MNLQTLTTALVTKVMLSLEDDPEPDTNKMKEDISKLQSQVVELKADVTEVKDSCQNMFHFFFI
jgi:hypothetical protein